ALFTLPKKAAWASACFIPRLLWKPIAAGLKSKVNWERARPSGCFSPCRPDAGCRPQRALNSSYYLNTTPQPVARFPLLIVDDDEGIRSQMKWALAEDYDVSIAQDGPGAVEVF